MKEYKVLYHSSLVTLTGMVNDCLKKGGKLAGSMEVVSHYDKGSKTSALWFYQPMLVPDPNSVWTKFMNLFTRKSNGTRED